MWFEHPAAAGLSERSFDLCVIGSGPAGMTLALELGRLGFTVALLEAGPEHYDAQSQAAYEGHVVGPLTFPLDVGRLRYLGGSSNHWGGFCQTLDAIDFETKIPGIETAWPLKKQDLDPYLSRAEAILQLPADAPARPLGAHLQHRTMRYSPPVNFARTYSSTLRQSPHISTVLNACVTAFEEREGRIITATVRDPAGRTHQVRARRYALCTGGIENSRLLLWANHQSGQRIVKNPDVLGRYWFEHPHFTLGEVVLETQAPFHFDAWNISWVSLTEAAMRAQGVLHAGLRLTRQTREASRQILTELACVAPNFGRWALERFNRRLICGALLRGSWEQSPRPWNRIVLSHKHDAWGIPKAELHWRFSELERRTILRSATLLAETLIHHGYGRIRLDPWLIQGGAFPRDDEIKGNHHMGGTRMSTDPRTGVVNPDCRVHGLSNLYIGGSSVFPSGGAANPTLTIVQLALRLADHLALSDH